MMGYHITAAAVVMSLMVLGCAEEPTASTASPSAKTEQALPRQRESRPRSQPTTKASATSRKQGKAPGQDKIPTFGPEIARLAKDKKAIVLLVTITRVATGRRRQSVYFDVKHVYHFGEDVWFLSRDDELYWAYNDGGRRFSRTFQIAPFPRNGIEKGGTYWLAVTQFMSSGIWVVAREQVRPK